VSDASMSQPAREGEPSACTPYNQAQGLRHDDQQSSPYIGRMQPPVSNYVVENASEKYQVGQTEEGQRPGRQDEGKWQPGGRRGENGDCRQEHQSLVSLALPPKIETGRDQDRKHQNVEERDSQEDERRRQARRGESATGRVNRDNGADHDHDRGKDRADNPQAAMNVGTFGCYQGDLSQEKGKPGREQNPVQMEEQGERRPSEKVFEKIGARETGEDNGGGQDRHADVEEAIASPGRNLCGCCQIIASVQWHLPRILTCGAESLTPDKRAYRRSGVLVRKMSGNPTRHPSGIGLSKGKRLPGQIFQISHFA
jgi:hypothetical protein